MSVKEQALEYLGRCWSIIPIEPRGKYAHKGLLRDTENNPYHWQYWQNARPDAKTVNYWFDTDPDANIAVVCGGISGVIVIDIDEPEAAQVLRAFLPADFVMPIVGTKRGWHWYFKLSPFKSLGGSGPGFDVRSEGDYALLPPSVHESGLEYTWLVPLTDELPEMPETLMAYLQKNARYDFSNSPHEFDDEEDEDESDYDDYDDDFDDDFEDDLDDDGSFDGKIQIDAEIEVETLEPSSVDDRLAVISTAEKDAIGEPMLEIALYDNKRSAEADPQLWGEWKESDQRFIVGIDDIGDELNAKQARMLGAMLLKAADLLEEYEAKDISF